MIARIVIGTAACVGFVVTYLLVSMLAWVMQGLAGVDRMNSAEIGVALFLGHAASLVLAILAGFAIVRLGATIHDRFTDADRRKSGRSDRPAETDMPTDIR